MTTDKTKPEVPDEPIEYIQPSAKTAEWIAAHPNVPVIRVPKPNSHRK